MIQCEGKLFWLNTADTSYLFEVTQFGHLEHIYYGPVLRKGQSLEALRYKRTILLGSAICYEEKEDTYSLDNLCLEWSGIGRGDFRYSPMEIKMPDESFVNDFCFKGYEIYDGYTKANTLPTAYGTEEDCSTLIITMEDQSNQTELKLYYTVFEETNVITRRTVLINNNEKKLTIRRAFSMMVDIPNRNYELTTFHGGWIKETHRQRRKISYGMHVNASTTGNSSNRLNPGFLLSEERATEENGWVYGFNLVYSGNHMGVAELSNTDILRVAIGINSHCFEWNLNKGESFETPEAVMSFSSRGFNGLSHNFHDFINEHIVRGGWKKKERPVLSNNWEAHFFDFNESKLLKFAKKASNLGIELFVMDDGWFGQRNSDTAGLGDYNVNRKKLPDGIVGLSEKIHKMGMKFGIWVEPEMVNEDSDLYRNHPEYAVKLPGKRATLGRHQMILDLCKPEVQDYIVDSVSKVLDEGKVTYVKWDMNRHMSEVYSKTLENQGEFFHRYIIGLYSVLGRIFESRPDILLETCSSGGNRFDLGMLCYSPQIWASDDTDPIERIRIQEGLSYLYPLSSMGAHVSSAPHQQTLRRTPLSTRFNVAAFGCLGYEMDFKYLSKVEKQEIADQIAFYKKHRHTFQYGQFSRVETDKDNKEQWQCTEKDGSKAIIGFFQTLTSASEGYDYLRVYGLETEATYCFMTKEQNLYVQQFGNLVKHLLPVELNPDGAVLRIANQVYCMKDGTETYQGQGQLFESGVLLNNQFMGTGYNKNIRVMGDFGSNLYIIQKQDEESERQ